MEAITTEERIRLIEALCGVLSVQSTGTLQIKKLAEEKIFKLLSEL